MVQLLSIIVALGLQTALFWWLLRPQNGRGKVPEGPCPALARCTELEIQEQRMSTRVAELEIQVRALPGFYKEQADRAERAAERERKAAKSRGARAADSSDGQDQDGAPGVHDPDGSRGSLSGVLPMHREVALTPEEIRREAARAFAFLNRG